MLEDHDLGNHLQGKCDREEKCPRASSLESLAMNPNQVRPSLIPSILYQQSNIHLFLISQPIRYQSQFQENLVSVIASASEAQINSPADLCFTRKLARNDSIDAETMEILKEKLIGLKSRP